MTESARRLLVIYTGGTLGMLPSPQGRQPGADLQGWLDGLMRTHLPEAEWEMLTLEPLIDSSNADPSDWQRIIDVIAAHAATHQAFVVLHGTDTMAYTAAAVACVPHDPPLPVVFTGAMRSLVEDGSDASANVMGAIRAALDARFGGVAIFFDGVLLDGRYATKISSQDDHGFDTPDHDLLGVRGPHGIQLVREPEPLRPLLDGPVRPFADVDLVIITLHPGLKASRVQAQLTPPPQGVVLRAYGVGNAPDNDPELLAALRGASDAGAVIVATTQCLHGGVELGHYAVSQGLLGAGAVSGEALPPEAIVARLSFLISQGLPPEAIRETFRVSCFLA